MSLLRTWLAGGGAPDRGGLDFRRPDSTGGAGIAEGGAGAGEAALSGGDRVSVHVCVYFLSSV